MKNLPTYFTLYFLFILSATLYIYSQEKIPTPQIDFSGYIRHSILYDSRQTNTFTEGMFIFFPLPQILDRNNQDINSRGQFNMLNVQSRLRLNIFGPDIHRAQTRGYIECDFQGRKQIGNLIKMRHTYIRIDWNNFSLLAGQTDNPMYVEQFEPLTVAVDGGAPFNTYGHNCQLRLTYNQPYWRFKATAITQLERASDGPYQESTIYLRNALVPHLDAQINIYPHKNIFFASSINFKRIAPRIFQINNNALYKAHEFLNSVSTFALVGFLVPEKNISCSSKIIYSQNLREYEMFSGYAIQSSNPLTGAQTYTNTQVVGMWTDIDVKYSSCFNPGLFVGYTKNYGFTHSVDTNLLLNGAVDPTTVYARAPTLDYMIGIMPRAYWYINQLTVGAEIQYNRAAFGTIRPDGTICNATPVNSVRLHVAFFYNF